MEITPVEQRLANAGLRPPRLNALRADDTLYTVLAHQPPGRIRISAGSIGHADQAEAHQRLSSLLRLASSAEVQPDLLVSPEYSVPWDTLVEAIETDRVPEPGRLWVLGCESLPLNGLDAIRTRLGALAVVLDDDLSPIERTTQQYRNPLCYVFKTTALADQKERLVVLVQYKTAPSGDPANTEATGMLPGVCVYAFGTQPGEVRLITLICSDVFNFDRAQIDQYYEGLLLLHIQLNNSPRHVLYKQYRPQLFSAAGKTELLCLNWSEKVVSVDAAGENENPWGNICGSAWYLLSPDTNLTDESLHENHKHGIYYTRHEPIRVHALQFNYRPRVFLLQSTKVFHHAIPRPRSMRTGPKALKTFIWAQDAMAWVEPREPDEHPNDGFCEQLDRVANGIALDDIRDLYRASPVAVERAMAITAGAFGVKPNWHSPALIDSMQLCEEEVVRRITVTQDPAHAAVHFRNGRLARTGAVAELRANGYVWPSSVEALRKGFRFNWLPRFPNRNVVAQDGTLATVVYAGLVADQQELELLDQKVRKTLAGPPREPERVLTEEQEKHLLRQHYANGAERFCIVYATATGSKNYLSGRDTAFARQEGQSAVDIGIPSLTRLSDQHQDQGGEA